MRAILLLVLSPSIAFAQPSAGQLANLDVTVAPETERKSLSNMVADHLRARQREANDRSSAEWKAIQNREQWEAFVRPKLKALRESLGTFPEPRVPAIRVTSTVDGDGFAIDNLLYESRPGLWVTANLYRPAKPTNSMPGMVIVHAHHAPKEHGELQDMGMTWARAGCLVLVPDMLGHGERRQHPFVDASSYAKPYRVSRQDYFFRYDNGIRLHLVGESLIGWMAWDIWRGVDMLLKQKGCDPKRLILLGSVAGGGDPCAVAAALDDRIAAAVPFNFGGPQPESRYPLPDDAETSFNYLGGGSWESTRNLRLSGRDGFLPWVIVGSLASRKLVYAHEFNWDRERDPVWKRLQTIAGWYGKPENLTFSYGRGSVRGSSPEDTHCTHIGPVQRKSIHEAFHKWFGIEAVEYSKRVPAEKLKCWTAEVAEETVSLILGDTLIKLGNQQFKKVQARIADKSIAESRKVLQEEWTRVLGSTDSPKSTVRIVGRDEFPGGTIERVILSHESNIQVPVVLLRPAKVEKPPVVVVLAQAGKAKLLKERADEYVGLLSKGIAVCLPDVRGIGETSMGNGRGRNSAATSYSSSLLMHGDPLMAGQLRDLRAVLAWLKNHESVNGKKPILWGDSLAKANDRNTIFSIPRDDDALLPPACEPMGGLLAILGLLYEDDVMAIHLRGTPWQQSAFAWSYLSFMPHDALVPGIARTGDVSELLFKLADRPIAIGDFVEIGNVRVTKHPFPNVATEPDPVPWTVKLVAK